MNKRWSFPLPVATSSQMSDAPLPSAEYYRAVAEEIRQFAERSQLPDVRRELLDLAERFERMAERADRRQNPPE